MKFVRFLGVLLFFVPCMSFAASSSDFQNASNLLSAARRGDTQTVQILINNGADINYTDASGLSLVCTAVMNNDKRAIQILQMYGADASNCDRQIKKYRQKSKKAVHGEEYGFFSGLSSSHVILLSAIGVAAVVGGVALLTNAFDAKNNNPSSPSGGSHSGSGGGSGGGGGSAAKSFTVPYGPAYLTVEGKVDPNADIAANLASWDARDGNAAIRVADFNYFRPAVDTTNNFDVDGIVSTLQNYLLVMHGYNSFANGYMGQYTFRNDTSLVPEMSQTGYQKQPVRVGLITGNGINPVGSADLGDGIVYVTSTSLNADPIRVDKYVNNVLNKTTVGDDVVYSRTEQSGFDLSGSGSAFNPFATSNDTALAKIVAGWEAGGRTNGDLYGFVPNGQLAIFRTGNGNVWVDTGTTTNIVGTLGGGDGVLSVGDTIEMTDTGYKYTVVSALYPNGGDVPETTVSAGGTNYKLSSNSKMFLAKCNSSGCENDIAIYIGTDGYWYVNSTGGNDIDAVYAVDDSFNIYQKKEQTSSAYSNFQALNLAVNSANALNVVAMTNLLSDSTNTYYMTVKDFAVAVKDNANVAQAYQNVINYYYDHDKYVADDNPVQGALANLAFSSIAKSDSTTLAPMILMPAGDYLAETSIGTKYAPEDAIFENYAPLVYPGTLNHNFMTIVAVNNSGGTASSNTIDGYGDGVANGQLMLSQWADSSGNAYISRKCGLAGSGSGSVDPWCFAASGPTTEMATAAAAGAVASVKSAFPYMTNDQVFTLLALTAEGPFLKTKTNGTVLNSVALANYLNEMYDLPTEQSFDSLTTDAEAQEYLAAFKDVYGYGLINLERAIKPGYSVYYYSSGNIVSSSGNKFWGNISTSRASTVLGARGAIKTSFYDVIESIDGSLSLPRVWNSEISFGSDSKHSLYMGDVLAEFNVDSTNKHTKTIDNMTFDMAMSSRAYNDGMNGLDNLKVTLNNENYELDAGYQRYLTDGNSRFSGRANGVLSLVSNSVTSGAKYKYGNFAFGGHAFSGVMSDENLLQTDPVVSSQFEPARLGLANGGAMDFAYNNDKFNFNVSFGNMHETNTFLGSVSDGLLSLNGADTQYVDAVANYKPFDKVNLSARATFANTHANIGSGIISELSDIQSNAFALGADAYGFSFTAAMPLAAVNGKMGYDYADLSVVENNGGYEVAINNPHIEYIDLASKQRELRFSGSYTRSLGEFTDAGLGFVYRVNPGNTDVFGNESILMFKLHHRLGI